MNSVNQPLPPPEPPDFAGTAEGGDTPGPEPSDGQSGQGETGSFFAETVDPSAEAEGDASGESFFASAADPSAEEGSEAGSFFAETVDPSAEAEGDASGESLFASAADPSTEEDSDVGSFFAKVADPSADDARADSPSEDGTSGPGEDHHAKEAVRVEQLGPALDPDPPHQEAQHGGPESLAGPRSAPAEGVEVSRLDDDRLRSLAKELEQARTSTPESPEQAAERVLLERTENKLKAELAARGMLTDPELRVEHMLVEHRLNQGNARAGDLEYSIQLKWEILTRFDYTELLSVWDSCRDSLAKGDYPRRAVDLEWQGLLEQQLLLRERAASPDGSARMPWIHAQPGQPGALASPPERPPASGTISFAQFVSDFIDVLPYAGAAKALDEGMWGRNALTGEELSMFERVLGAAAGGYEVLGPAFSGPAREPAKADTDPTVPGTPAGSTSASAEPAASAADEGMVWVNKSSNKYHAEGSAQGQRLEQDPDRGTHWEKMSRQQADGLGFDAARTGDPLREQALGRERVADFLTDYVEGGRERMFDAPANPLAIHQEVPLYSRLTVDGKDYYVRSDPRRTLDIVDLTDAGNPKAFEIGTQTPSRSEIERKDNQTAAWEAAREEAEDLRREGGDGRVYGELANGTFVDLTAAEYIIPPDVRHLVGPSTGPEKP